MEIDDNMTTNIYAIFIIIEIFFIIFRLNNTILYDL